MESQVQTLVESGEEDSSEVRTQIYVEQMGSETRNRVRGYGHGVIPEMVSYTASSSARPSKKSRGALAKMVAENNELRRREEEASKKLAEITAELEKSKTSQEQVNQQQQTMMQQMLMQQQQIFMWLLPQHLQRPPLSPQTSQHSAPAQPLPCAPAYPIQNMSFHSQYPVPVYRPQMATPGDSHITPGVGNGGFSPGLFSGLLSGSFDGDVMRFLGAHGVLTEGLGSHGASAEGSGAHGGGPAEGSGSIE